jgi:hypothetical protein
MNFQVKNIYHALYIRRTIFLKFIHIIYTKFKQTILNFNKLYHRTSFHRGFNLGVSKHT